MAKQRLSAISRRLLPLYVSVFFQGFVLWYGIEKLFMTGIGFDNASIAIMAVTWSAVMLLAETPSGLLADRWSRKGVLIIAGMALTISSLIGGLSTDIFTYLIATVFWGIFFALYSGTYDSIVYDTLTEEKGSSDGYEKYYGRVRFLDGLALVIATLVGGVIGQLIGLSETYFMTIPISLLSVGALFLFKEPKIHLVHEHASLKLQIKATFAAITQKGIVLYLILALVFGSLVSQLIFEFNQLWLIALAAPVVFYAVASALLLSSLIFAGSIAQYFSRHKTAAAKAFVVILIGAGLCLALVKNLLVIAVACFLIALTLIVYEIIFSKQLHDRLTSNIRSGAMSSISSLTRLLFIPTALVFGFVSQEAGIFNAAWIVVGLIIVASIIILRTTGGLRVISDKQAATLVVPDEYHK